MALLTDIPPEIQLQFFSYLPLKALIAAHGVSHRWRLLISYADILSARRALLDLYLKILASPLFIPTRACIVDRLRHFDRQKYLDKLMRHHRYQDFPEEFRVWVLEWPARAVIQRCWPGLPLVGASQFRDDDTEMFSETNWLASALPFLDVPGEGIVPALCLWADHTAVRVTWLVLGERNWFYGMVYVDNNRAPGGDYVFASFIEWQKYLWQQVEEEAALASAHPPLTPT
jgi:F-box-like